LSLAVSDSFLPKRGNGSRRKRDEGRDETRRRENGPYGLPLDPPRAQGSSGPSREPQISSFSSSCTQPALDLIAYPILLPLLAPDFSAPSLLRLFPIFPLSPFFSELLPSRSPRTEVASERGERESRIDLMRIIPALIAGTHGMVQAVLVRPAAWPAGWLADSLTDRLLD